MAGSGALDEQYDFALLGTSLPLSILSAALARAGFSVLHVDDAEHYGGPWSSLTLSELAQLVQRRSDAEAGAGGIYDISLTFRGSSDVPPALGAVNRHFAISLAPTLLPCTGATIDVLVRSKVASYCTFRLLQQTAVYSNEVRAKDAWPLRSVPSSKEDIFKDKSLSLVDKRRLMKLLQQASGAPSTQQPTDVAHVDIDDDDASRRRGALVASLSGSFQDYLTSRTDGPGFSARLASDVAYGVALCSSSDEPAVAAMRRLQRHIASVGRYGNAAYLIGQYGGAGEMAQCYCRSSAVQGSTFVLGHGITMLERQDRESEDAQLTSWEIALDGIGGTSKVDCVVGDADLLRRIGRAGPSKPSAPHSRQALGILLLDRGISLKSLQPDDAQATPPPETALLVFPPPDDSGTSAQDGSVWALQMGEGTFSCPKGTYIVYLCAALPQPPDKLSTAEQARVALQHAREGVLRLAQQSEREWRAGESEETEDGGSVSPLFECYMVRESAAALATEEQQRILSENGLLSVSSSTLNLATALDDATTQAEDLYWLLCGQGGAMNREGAEVLRRRQRRTVATYAVGRGLGGVLPTDENTSVGEATTVSDFFPIADEDDGAD